jgi:hypothetical protein
MKFRAAASSAIITTRRSLFSGGRGTPKTTASETALARLRSSGVPEASDNPNFAVRIAFARTAFQIAESSGLGGNNRFDGVVVSGDRAQVIQLAFAPLGFRGVQGAVLPGTLEVRAHGGDGALDTQFNGTVTLELVGDGTLGGAFSAVADEGIAVFHNWFVTGLDGSFELLATAHGSTPARSGPLFLSTFPVFLPAGQR